MVKSDWLARLALLILTLINYSSPLGKRAEGRKRNGEEEE